MKANAWHLRGHLGIYGDFLYSATHTRYGSGILETMSGPTVGPLLEFGLINPLQAVAANIEGKQGHFLAKEARVAKGFVPFANIWYTKAALDHLIFNNVMESLSPGYLNSIRRRSMKEQNQDWWYDPSDTIPDRWPDLGAAVKR